MTQNVTLEDGSIHSFPDDATPEEMTNSLSSIPNPTSFADNPTMSNLGNAFMKTVKEFPSQVAKPYEDIGNMAMGRKPIITSSPSETAGNILTMAMPFMGVPEKSSAPEPIKIMGDYMKMDNTNPASLSPSNQQTIGDLAGPNLQTLIEGRAQTPGSAMTSAVDMMGQRNVSQPSRIDDLINQHIGNPSYNAQRQQQLSALGSQPVQDAYRNAYDFAPAISDSGINSLLGRLNDTSVGKRILGNAQDTAKLAGKSLYAPRLHGESPSISTYGIDTIKQSADQIIRSSSAQGNFDKYTTQGKNLSDLISSLVDKTDKINPLYPQARKTYSNPASLINAGDLGYKDIWGANSADAIKEFNGLDGAEKDAALSGVARKVSENLKTQAGDKLTPNASNTPLEFTKNAKNLEILQQVLPADNYKNFISGLTDEANMQTFANKILSNSATARRQAAQQDFENRTASAAESKIAPTANYLANFAIDKPGSWFGITSPKVENWAQNMSASNRNEIGSNIAQAMLSQNPVKNAATLASIQKYLDTSGMRKPGLNGVNSRILASSIPFSLSGGQ